MHTEFLMGNAAIAMGAMAAGLNLISGYPGTPSTEVLATTAKRKAGAKRVGITLFILIWKQPGKLQGSFACVTIPA